MKRRLFPGSGDPAAHSAPASCTAGITPNSWHHANIKQHTQAHIGAHWAHQILGVQRPIRRQRAVRQEVAGAAKAQALGQPSPQRLVPRPCLAPICTAASRLMACSGCLTVRSNSCCRRYPRVCVDTCTCTQHSSLLSSVCRVLCAGLMPSRTAFAHPHT